MFAIFRKDPLKQLNQKYTDLLSQAQHAQRNGDIELYSRLSSEADVVLKQIDQAEAATK